MGFKIVIFSRYREDFLIINVLSKNRPIGLVMFVLEGTAHHKTITFKLQAVDGKLSTY